MMLAISKQSPFPSVSTIQHPSLTPPATGPPLELSRTHHDTTAEDQQWSQHLAKVSLRTSQHQTLLTLPTILSPDDVADLSLAPLSQPTPARDIGVHHASLPTPRYQDQLNIPSRRPYPAQGPSMHPGRDAIMTPSINTNLELVPRHVDAASKCDKSLSRSSATFGEARFQR